MDLLVRRNSLSTHKTYSILREKVKTEGKKRETLVLLSLLTFMSSIETLVNGQNMLKCKCAAMCLMHLLAWSFGHPKMT